MARIVRTARIIAAAGVFCGFSTAAFAEPPARLFAELERWLTPGQTIFVVDRLARETSGVLASLSPTSLTVVVSGEERQIEAADIGLIETRGDSVGNGALNGILASAPHWLIGSAFVCYEQGGNCSVNTGLVLMAPWAAIGAVVDWAHKGRTVVYHAVPGTGRGPVTGLDSLWMRARSGDVVRLVDTDNTRMNGTLVEVSEHSIVMLINGQLRTLASDRVREVSTPGDSVRNGALIGAAFGFIAAGAAAGDTEGGDVVVWSALVGASIYGLIGAGIDALIPGRTAVYRPGLSRSVHLVPVLGRDRRGFALSMSF